MIVCDSKDCPVESFPCTEWMLLEELAMYVMTCTGCALYHICFVRIFCYTCITYMQMHR